MLHPDVQMPTANLITNSADGLDFKTPNVLFSKANLMTAAASVIPVKK